MRSLLVVLALLVTASWCVKDSSEYFTEKVIEGMDELETGIKRLVKMYDKYISQTYKRRNFVRKVLKQASLFLQRQEIEDMKIQEINANEDEMYRKLSSYFLIDNSHAPMLMQIQVQKEKQQKQLQKRRDNYCRNRHKDCSNVQTELQEIKIEQEEYKRFNSKIKELMKYEKVDSLSVMEEKELKMIKGYIQVKEQKLKKIEELLSIAQLGRFNLYRAQLKIKGYKTREIKRLKKLNSRNKKLLKHWGKY